MAELANEDKQEQRKSKPEASSNSSNFHRFSERRRPFSTSELRSLFRSHTNIPDLLPQPHPQTRRRSFVSLNPSEEEEEEGEESNRDSPPGLKFRGKKWLSFSSLLPLSSLLRDLRDLPGKQEVFLRGGGVNSKGGGSRVAGSNSSQGGTRPYSSSCSSYSSCRSSGCGSGSGSASSAYFSGGSGRLSYCGGEGGWEERVGVGREERGHPFFNCYQKGLGRSMPTLLESMDPGGGALACGSNHTHLYSVDAVMPLLQEEVAVLTGARSPQDHYILILPDRGNFHLLAEDEYRRLVLYLTSLPPMQDAESGFIIIVDRRNDKWNSVKTTLLRLSNYFPAPIHRVFVLRPSTLFQKALSEISAKLFRVDSLRFPLTLLNSLTELHGHLPPSTLTPELGGTLPYQKGTFLSQRVEVEAFHVALQSLSRDLKAFTQTLSADLNDPESTEALLSIKQAEFSRLKADLTQSAEHGDHLLFRIRSEGHSPVKGQIQGQSQGHPINVLAVERYILQIQETSRLFSAFWDRERGTLEGILGLRRFEVDFRALRGSIGEALRRLEEELGDVGETLAGTEALLRATLSLEEEIEVLLSRAHCLSRQGRALTQKARDLDLDLGQRGLGLDSVEPKCLELDRLGTELEERVRAKLERQREWKRVQVVIERANDLCGRGLDLASSSEDFLLGGGGDFVDGLTCGGTLLVGRIDDFMDRLRGIVEELVRVKDNIGSPKEGERSPTRDQIKPLIKQVLKRVEDVEVMCIKKKSAITSHLAATQGRKLRRSSGSSSADSRSSPLKTAKSVSHLDLEDTTYSSPNSLRSTSGGSTLSLDGREEEDEPDQLQKVKRGHVLNELLVTERSYVEEMNAILRGYRDSILEASSSSRNSASLPPQLLPLPPPNPKTPPTAAQRSPNISVLFCNLEEIQEFHRATFLPSLESCLGSMDLLGLSFIHRHSEFLSLYSQYCQLLPASEALRKEIGENHPFLLEVRQRLGHKLPLGAYLLKPVQRITKYHLLLKDLLKASEGCQGQAELSEALECMLVVLRCVNDGMHQLGITGYPGPLTEQGYLLLQGAFLLWTENKRDLRLLKNLKGHPRHLFLYQRSILLTKRLPKSTLYEFRERLSLSQLSLNEGPSKGSQPQKKFELFLQGSKGVARSFLLQAESTEARDLWVREIKKLLLDQLQVLRAGKRGRKEEGRGRLRKALTLGPAPSSRQHPPLRETGSWDTTTSASNTNLRSSGEEPSSSEDEEDGSGMTLDLNLDLPGSRILRAKDRSSSIPPRGRRLSGGKRLSQSTEDILSALR